MDVNIFPQSPYELAAQDAHESGDTINDRVDLDRGARARS